MDGTALRVRQVRPTSDTATRKASAATAVSLLIAALVVGGCDTRSKEQRQEIARIQQAVGANPGAIDVPDRSGLTPLHVAVLNDYLDLADWLLDRNANPNVPNARGQTPLGAAILLDRSPGAVMVALLLSRGASPNARTSYGETALHTAASFGHAAQARLLLAAGADVEARAGRGETPLHYVSRVATAAQQNTVDQVDVEATVEVLVASKANVNGADANGATALHLATMSGNAATARLLLDRGAAVDATNRHGATPLHYAATFGRAEIADLLLARGASVARVDEHGRTPLRSALEAPAQSYDASGKRPVNVSAVVAVLRRRGA